ncbi:MAG: PEGA domain-containing protein, partial [Acidobacteria bacterium]|nr:PEGA domain-containing protein [Acidobacteriota bacterium]
TSKSGNDATTSSSSSGNRREAPTRDNGQEVPSWSRPRGDRPAVDTAAERSGRIPDRNSRGGFYGRSYDPFYPSFYGSSPYSYYSGFGLGYGYGFGWPLFYDPWYDPYGGVGYGGGYGGGGYYRGTQYASIDQGRVRLKVKPRNAKVYVDGYFVGDVDQFDGAFQKLSLNGGRHHVEIKADGYETAEFDVMIMPDQTITYAGELKRIQ